MPLCFTCFNLRPLHLAAIHNHPEVIEVLASRGADLELLSGFLDKSPLHLACEHGHLEAVEKLIRFGANPNTTGIHVTNPSSIFHSFATTI